VLIIQCILLTKVPQFYHPLLPWYSHCSVRVISLSPSI